MSIKHDLDYLEETKGLIKQAIINKGQDIDDTTPFRSYVDKINNISGGGAITPMGVKLYKQFEILDDQTDLVNYYLSGVQSGNFMNLNCYQLRFSNLDTTINIPEEHVLFIVGTCPAMMCLATDRLSDTTPTEGDIYYFNPNYTQAFIQIARQIGVYDNFVGNFLNKFNITESALSYLNGWYLDENNTLNSTTHPIMEHVHLFWILKTDVQNGLINNYTISNALDYIDLNEIQINITRTNEDTFNDVISKSIDLAGNFLSDANVYPENIVSGITAYGKDGRIVGTMINNGQINITPSTSAQTILAGYTSGGTVAAVTSTIDSDISAPNIKPGVNILGVDGTFTNDATATANDIVKDTTAYVKGVKINGAIEDLRPHSSVLEVECATCGEYDPRSSLNFYAMYRKPLPNSFDYAAIGESTAIHTYIPYSMLVANMQLTADKLKKGVTLLGVTGTYEGEGMKEYASEATMNADINNIALGEVVKVVASNITTFYVKEAKTTYQPVDFSTLSIGDTISLKDKKISRVAKANIPTGEGANTSIAFSYNNQNVLEISFHGGASSISGTVILNDGNQYNYASATVGGDSILSDSDVITINSSSIWTADTLLTISGEDIDSISGAILEPIQNIAMKKLIKEEDTLSVPEYNEATDLSEDILGNS